MFSIEVRIIFIISRGVIISRTLITSTRCKADRFKDPSPKESGKVKSKDHHANSRHERKTTQHPERPQERESQPEQQLKDFLHKSPEKAKDGFQDLSSSLFAFSYHEILWLEPLEHDQRCVDDVEKLWEFHL